MSNKWSVYKITSPNGRVYVGCTGKSLEKRFQNGRGYKFIPEMYNDILNYGWNNFIKEVIYECFDEAEARQREHEEIKKHPNGYNRYRGQKHVGKKGIDDLHKPKVVVCLDTGEVYRSIYRAAQKTGLHKNKISNCCRGLQNKTGGLHWAFLPNDYSEEWRKAELEKKREIDKEINEAKLLRMKTKVR